MWTDHFESPIGTIDLIGNGDALCALDFADCRERLQRLFRAGYGDVALETARAPAEIRERLTAYFGGVLAALQGMRVELRGSEFQRRVWNALRDIEPGTTCSYGAIAGKLGRPGSSRAVGTANGRNPIALVVPCHRVIAANGTLSGYAGGVQRKQWLLHHEGIRM